MRPNPLLQPTSYGLRTRLSSNVKPHSWRNGTLHRLLLLTLLALTACSRQGAMEDQYLRCKGRIAWVTGTEPLVEEDQEIAAHIQRSAISFSGNATQFGQDIPICLSTRGESIHNESYFFFDSASCAPSAVVAHNRTYGTYNWVLAKLELTNTSLGADMPIKGTFTCVAVDSRP